MKDENNNNFSNLDAAGNQVPTINNLYYQRNPKPDNYGVWYKATEDWTDIYGAGGI
jgi:hypothetical protein